MRDNEYNSAGNSKRETDVIFVWILTTVAENNIYYIIFE